MRLKKAKRARPGQAAGPKRALRDGMTKARRQPRRRVGDRGWVLVVGWLGCVTLAASLGFTFVQSLVSEPPRINPLFFALQVTASCFFLLYSLKLRNYPFVVANGVALLTALGTLTVLLLR